MGSGFDIGIELFVGGVERRFNSHLGLWIMNIEALSTIA
jgi:phosphomevalonate kinase